MGVHVFTRPLYLNNNSGGPTQRGVCLALTKANQPIHYSKYDIACRYVNFLDYASY